MRLPQKLDRLQELVAAFYQIGSSIDLAEVLQHSLDSATRLMNANAGSIALIDDDGANLRFVQTSSTEAADLKGITVPLGHGICGHVAQTGTTVRLADAKNDPRFYDGVDRRLGKKTTSYLCTPLLINGTAIGTAQVLNRRDGQPFTDEDELLLEGFARQAALAIQNARLHELELRQQAIDAELATCAAIQQKLFPEQLPTVPGFEVFARSQPCRQVGGDYYTFLNRGDGCWDVALADVSGKGLSAAMIVADLHSGLHLLSPMENHLATMLGKINRHLLQSTLDNRFVTMVMARLDPARAQVAYVVAGHTPPVVITPSGEITRLQVTGPILGVIDQELNQDTVALGPGDLLACYTDGYAEAEGAAEVQLGDQAIINALQGWRDLPLDKIADKLDQLTEQHRQGRPAHDDLTLLLVRRR